VRVLSIGAAAALAEDLRRDGKRVVFTNGVFDLLHPGHHAVRMKKSVANDGTDRSAPVLAGLARFTTRYEPMSEGGKA